MSRYDFTEFPNITITGIHISSLNETELAILYAQARYCQAMTDADIDTMRELVAKDMIYTHMSGKQQTRECMRLKPIIMKIPGKKEGNDNSFLISLTVPKGVEPSSSGRQPDIICRYTTEPDGRNCRLRSDVSALSAQRSAIELSS